MFSNRAVSIAISISVALALLAIAPAAPVTAADPAPSVTMVISKSESPGALVNGIVTVWNAPVGYAANLVIAGISGPTVTCVGDPWVNPLAHSISRTCFVRLPMAPATYSIKGVATLTKDSSPTLVVESLPRAITAKGPVSTVPMTVEHAQEIDHCGNQTDNVWLTFDDSLNGGRLITVMQVLRANNVRGRFFMTGKWLNKHPQNLLVMLDNGHLAGNHSLNHPSLTTATDAEVLRQIDRGVPSTTEPKLFRPPYGLGAYTSRLEDLAATRGHSLCRWTTDTYDWDNESVQTMLGRIAVGDYRSAPIAAGGVILMHGHGEHTMEALQGIIDAVRDKGLTLDPLGPAPTIRRPDALVSLTQTGPYAGDGFYHHAPISNQTKRRDGVKKNTNHAYFIRVQNDGNVSDDLLVQAVESGTGRMKITYWVGDTDVTTSVRGAGYTFSGVAPGETRELVVKVSVGKAPSGSKRIGDITVRSTKLPTRFDFVRVLTRR